MAEEIRWLNLSFKDGKKYIDKAFTISQYDYGRKLRISDTGYSDATKFLVQFSGVNSSMSIASMPVVTDGVIEADIPDELLTEQGECNVYIYVYGKDSDNVQYGITTLKASFTVASREKPTSLYYSQQDIIKIEDKLESKVAEVAGNIETTAATIAGNAQTAKNAATAAQKALVDADKAIADANTAVQTANTAINNAQTLVDETQQIQNLLDIIDSTGMIAKIKMSSSDESKQDQAQELEVKDYTATIPWAETITIDGEKIVRRGVAKPSDENPKKLVKIQRKVDGETQLIGNPGTADDYSRSDHQHPMPKANQIPMDSGLSTIEEQIASMKKSITSIDNEQIPYDHPKDPPPKGFDLSKKNGFWGTSDHYSRGDHVHPQPLANQIRAGKKTAFLNSTSEYNIITTTVDHTISSASEQIVLIEKIQPITSSGMIQRVSVDDKFYLTVTNTTSVQNVNVSIHGVMRVIKSNGQIVDIKQYQKYVSTKTGQNIVTFEPLKLISYDQLNTQYCAIVLDIDTDIQSGIAIKLTGNMECASQEDSVQVGYRIDEEDESYTVQQALNTIPKFQPQPVTNIRVRYHHNADNEEQDYTSCSFTMPQDTFIGGVRLSKLQSVTLVANKYYRPSSIIDGIVVEQFNATGAINDKREFVISNSELSRSYNDKYGEKIKHGDTIYLAFFPVDSLGSVGINEQNFVKLNLYQKYGFVWDTEQADPTKCIEYVNDNANYNPITKTDHGEWKDVWFVKYNKPYLVDLDCSQFVQINKDDWSKTTDGVDITNTVKGIGSEENPRKDVVVSMPNVYVHCSNVGAKYKIEVCSCDLSSGEQKWTNYAHRDEDNNILDYIYYGAYLNTLETATNLMRSNGTGAVPTLNQTLEQVMIKSKDPQPNSEQIHTVYGNRFVTNFHDRMLLIYLFLLLSKTTDSQTLLGSGPDGNGASYNAGATTSLGMFGATSNRVKYFGLQDIWGNRQQMVSGASVLDGEIKVWVPGLTLDATAGQLWQSIGFLSSDQFNMGTPSVGTFWTKPVINEYGIFPGLKTGVSGSASTYSCDWTSVPAATGQFRFDFSGSYYSTKNRMGILQIMMSAPINSTSGISQNALASGQVASRLMIKGAKHV